MNEWMKTVMFNIMWLFLQIHCYEVLTQRYVYYKILYTIHVRMYTTRELDYSGNFEIPTVQCA